MPHLRLCPTTTIAISVMTTTTNLPQMRTLMANEQALAAIDGARADIAAAFDKIAEAKALLTGSVPPTMTVITTPDALDRALSVATAGQTLVLDPTLVYPSPLTIRAPVALRPIALPEGRMRADVPLPHFTNGLTIAGDDVSIVGLDVRHSHPDVSIVLVQGARTHLERLRILGDPVKGARRGITANGNGQVVITLCVVADCMGAYPGEDHQAICAWDMAPGLTILDNYLEGGTETIMLGGGDPPSADRMPADVAILGNTITKKAAWQALPISVKNTLEIKAGKRVRIQSNDLSHSWGGRGQDGYLLMLTVRNQDGHAPWSTIEHVEILDNTWHDGAAAINLLGEDDRGATFPSGRMTRVRIAGNHFTALDPGRYTGSKRLIQIGHGPDALTIDQNEFAGVGFSSAVFFHGAPKLTSFTLTNNRWPKTNYGIFGDNATVGKAWDQYVASGVNRGNVEG
jgi:hypothetical protein